MKSKMMNRIGCAAIMLFIVGVGLFLRKNHRADHGKNIDYSLAEYRTVDPALLKYTELDPMVPTLEKFSALARAESGEIYIGGANGIQIVGGERFPILERRRV